MKPRSVDMRFDGYGRQDLVERSRGSGTNEWVP